MTTTPTTCTVVVRGDGSRCGAPAATSFTSRSGVTYHECAEHTYVPPVRHGIVRSTERETAASLGIKTRTTRPFVLVRDGVLVGYADAVTPAVEKRARLIGAKILPTK